MDKQTEDKLNQQLADAEYRGDHATIHRIREKLGLENWGEPKVGDVREMGGNQYVKLADGKWKKLAS
jgi:hypothetical protein